jgi:S-adenosylmethionine decarboxylase proenzyme
MRRLGRLRIGELFDCVPDILNELEALRSILLAMAWSAQATIVGSTCHQISPVGLRGVVVMRQGRLSLHTWPEHRYAAVDLVARDEALRLDVALECVIGALAAGRASVLEMHRAVFPAALAPGVRAEAGSAPAVHQDGRAPGQAAVLG